MDGTKSATDTKDFPQGSGRQAPGVGRTQPEREEGPRRNENPGGSRLVVV